ncbi:DNA-deoxyinosine glycosylase [Pectinatus cerevisiiphilus]|uniref:G/U mismatch-specific uracil-DNA glycosylase n=1 Tax=Pectinatus cerevisiiphilus TaxID=86956 RepID=A0A4R3K9Q4_9FIRM|nr:DNA-deoxyinosine glycosylase [Pectinatus cerevisiiphilus]TCS79678.1 G/U mismatch-specific uracil-DNA glycosylase [Pectinatus cerevisiiphilus]
MSLCKGFAPVVKNDAEILILGSMPSVASLAHEQYYAHPQNRFWRLMAKLLGYAKMPENYPEKLKMLMDNHIALWDAIASCEREGSLDSAIHREIPNDFSEFLSKYTKINTVCFNGGKAYQCFKKYNKNILTNDKYRFYSMPSTSPANARFKIGMLEDKWKVMLSAPK